jgi:16S rRNA (cytidine1402-2'-O)-methyltransferase
LIFSRKKREIEVYFAFFMISYSADTSGMLHVVATPIGNMGDITIRAKEILETVDIVVAEDTRQTKKIFSYYEIPVGEKKFWSFHAQSSDSSLEQIFLALGKGKNIALVSDAGTPGISDPGAKLIGIARKKGFSVSPIPGASAVIAALCASGLPTDRFEFLGFMPHKKGRQTLFQEIAKSEHTMVFYESVHRIEKCLDQMHEFFPEKLVCVAREITKKFEDFITGTPAQIQQVFVDHPEKQKGEFVVLVAGKKFSKKYFLADL